SAAGGAQAQGEDLPLGGRAFHQGAGKPALRCGDRAARLDGEGPGRERPAGGRVPEDDVDPTARDGVTFAPRLAAQMQLCSVRERARHRFPRSDTDCRLSRRTSAGTAQGGTSVKKSWWSSWSEHLPPRRGI